MGANRFQTVQFSVTGDPDTFNPIITAWLSGLSASDILSGDDLIITPSGPVGIDPPLLGTADYPNVILTMPNFVEEDGVSYTLQRSENVFFTFDSVADVSPNSVVNDTCNALTQWRIVASANGISVPGNPTYRES